MTRTLNINWTPDDGLPAPGQHRVAVTRATVRHRKDGESEYISLELEVTHGRHAGARLWMPVSLRPDMQRLLRQTLRAVGLPEDLRTLDVDDENGEAVIVDPVFEARTALADLVHETYQGEKRAKVRRLLPTEAGS